MPESLFARQPGSFALGVNYWASHAATEMWRAWDADAVDRDFAALAAAGIGCLRVFPRWDEFQPIHLLRGVGPPGGEPKEIRFGEDALPDTPAGRAGVSETMMTRFEAFADLAERHGLKLIVPLLTGHMTARLYVPPALIGFDLYTHPTALKWAAKFIHYFVDRMKKHPAIVAWESGNETRFLGAADHPDAAWAWTYFVHTAIRAADPDRPIVGEDAFDIVREPQGNWLIEDQAELSDVLSVHPYCMWGPAYREPYTQIRNLFHAAAECRLVGDVGAKPCFVEETGLWRPVAATRADVASAARVILWNVWAADGRGLLWWCAFDQEEFTFAPYDWNFAGLEHGVFSSRREAHPLAETFRRFAEFRRNLPFDVLPPAPADAVCIVHDKNTAHAAFVLARQAGRNPRFQSPRQALRESDVYWLPSARGRAHLPVARWRELRERVAAGATLYISLDETYLSGLDVLCGAAVVERRTGPVVRRFHFDGFDVSATLPVEYVMAAAGAETLATDESGHPVFFRMRHGAGTVYTLSFPLEKIALAETGLFAGDAWKLYQTLPGRPRVLPAGHARLTITEHPLGDGRLAAVLVNNAPEPLTEALAPAAGWRVAGQYTDTPDARLADARVHLPPHGTLLLDMASEPY